MVEEPKLTRVDEADEADEIANALGDKMISQFRDDMNETINQALSRYLKKHPEKCGAGGFIRCKSLNPLVIDEEAEENR